MRTGFDSFDNQSSVLLIFLKVLASFLIWLFLTAKFHLSD